MLSPDLPRLVERARLMCGRTQQCIIELNRIRARAERALKHAEAATLRANARLDKAAGMLEAIRERQVRAREHGAA